MANFDVIVAQSANRTAEYNCQVDNIGCKSCRLVVNVTAGGPGQFTPVIEFIDAAGVHHELLMGETITGIGEYRYVVSPLVDDDEDDEGISAKDFCSKNMNFKFLYGSGNLTFQAAAQFFD